MGSCTVVIGNFDGVHSGHRELVATAKAYDPDLPLTAVTFWPHPMSIVSPDNAPMLLLPLTERIARLEEAGVDDVLVLDFTKEFSNWSPKRFVTEILLPLDPAVVVVGENFRFGFRAQGDVAALREFGGGAYEVKALSLVRFGTEETCSTRIRRAVGEGDVETAMELLGRPVSFSGEVVHGNHRGRLLGFPTANLLVPKELACPADGVYAGWLNVPGERHPAAISVGRNPTFTGVEHRRVEAYALDRNDLDLYGLNASVDFVARIRGMIKFGSVDELVSQMRHDVESCRNILGLCLGKQRPARDDSEPA